MMILNLGHVSNIHFRKWHSTYVCCCVHNSGLTVRLKSLGLNWPKQTTNKHINTHIHEYILMHSIYKISSIWCNNNDLWQFLYFVTFINCRSSVWCTEKRYHCQCFASHGAVVSVGLQTITVKVSTNKTHKGYLFRPCETVFLCVLVWIYCSGNNVTSFQLWIPTQRLNLEGQVPWGRVCQMYSWNCTEILLQLFPMWSV